MVVRGCVHGGVVVCEVRVVASPVVRGRVDCAAHLVRAAPGTLRSAISWARPGAGPAGMGWEPELGPRRPWGEPSPGRVGPRSAWRRTPRASPRPPGAPGAGLRNASPAQHNPHHLAPCELSVTESACARFAPAHLARCELR